MTYLFIDHQVNDRIQRLAIGRQHYMDKRGARWAAPRNGGDKAQVRKMRTEQISQAGSASMIDSSHLVTDLHNSRRKD